MKIKRLTSLKTPEQFREHIEQLGIDLPFDDDLITGDASPLEQSVTVDGHTIGNRWAINPMEGWDGTTTGGSTDHMKRRWERFGLSGAKFIWGGEAMAVRADGRANPNQLIMKKENQQDIQDLHDHLIATHKEHFGTSEDLFVGFQLTHSGRFCRPNDKKVIEPRVAYLHPVLDKKFNVTGQECVWTDMEIDELIKDYIAAAKLSHACGAKFVDIKHCHGYLLHEFLSAHTRPGNYGGSFENRTRILREIVKGIKSECPGMSVGVRVSIFDYVPFRPDPEKNEGKKMGPGIPEEYSHALPYNYGFGINPDNPVEYDLSEPIKFLELLEELGVKLVNFSAGSPYYNPHIQRPALYPPSDGYQPCEDPLIGVARQLKVTKELKLKFPNLYIVGSAYSYLQEWLPNVAQHFVREGYVDFAGLGRIVLSYPDLPADIKNGNGLQKKKICRTFSDCTTAPRNGIISGCFPLDDYYKKSDEYGQLQAIKKG